MRQVESVLAMKKFMAAGIGLMGCIGLLMGCAEVVVPGAMAGGGEYYRYTTSNIAKETLIGDVRDVTAATRSAIKKMGIRLHSVTPYADETVMFVSAPELDITINIIHRQKRFQRFSLKTIVAALFTLPSDFWPAKMNRNTGKPGAGFPLMPVKKNTLPIPTTVIFTFMLKRAGRIKCTGAGKTFTGLRANVSVFSKQISAMTQKTSPSLSVVIDSR